MDVVSQLLPVCLDVKKIPPPAHLDVGNSLPPIRTDVAPNQDRLDALIVKAVASYDNSDLWDEFVRTTQELVDLHPDVGYLPNPASHLLKRLQQSGMPVIMKTVNWSTKRIQGEIK